MRKIVAILCLLLFAACLVWASTAGPNFAGAGANGGTGTAWVNPGNIVSTNTVYATCTVPGNGSSQYLVSSSYGFAIPAGSTINGITFAVIWNGTNGAGQIAQQSILAMKAGTAAGTDQSLGSNLPATDATDTFGGVSNLWGTTWTPSDINNSGFGVEVKVNEFLGFQEQASVDSMTITITYTLPPSGARRVFRTKAETETQTRAVSTVRTE